MRALQFPIGTKSGRLITTGEPIAINGRRKLPCRCECGTPHLMVDVNKFKTGHSKSCGCLRVEAVKAKNTTHGLAYRHPDYGRWKAMHARCYNHNHPQHKDYGGNGVTVCERWSGEDGFANFIADMGDKPHADYTVDRIDGSKGYSPDNCRWASRLVQVHNSARYNGIPTKRTLPQLQALSRAGLLEYIDHMKLGDTDKLIRLNKSQLVDFIVEASGKKLA